MARSRSDAAVAAIERASRNLCTICQVQSESTPAGPHMDAAIEAGNGGTWESTGNGQAISRLDCPITARPRCFWILEPDFPWRWSMRGR